MTGAARGRALALGMFAVWLVTVGCAAWNHAVWRDEVHALTRALDGRNPLEMMKALPAEGHPAVWYLLLRGAHALLPIPQVLQIVAFIAAAASALLLVLYAPFDWWVKVLLLAGNDFLFEYSVTARNYGITMVPLFLLAIFYKSHRDSGPLLGVLLFVLANCNVHAVLLVGGFLLLWLVDISTGDGASRPRAFRVFGWNAAIAMLGVALCAMTVIHSPQDRSQGRAQDRSAAPAKSGSALPSLMRTALKSGSGLGQLARAVLLPGEKFEHLVGGSGQTPWPGTNLYSVLLSVMLFGSTLGLIRYPGVFLAALATLVGFSFLFRFVYVGAYRHEALWLMFLAVCYWIAANKSKAPDRWPARFQAILGSASRAGWALFLLLLAIQVPLAVANAAAAISDDPPFSRSRDLGNLIHSRPEWRDAILMADPEFLLEPMPYYVSNPTYYPRRQRFDKLVQGLSRTYRMSLTLEDLLDDARRLHAETGKPVLILLRCALDPLDPPLVIHEDRGWDFTTTPEQERAFLGATQLIENFPSAVTDEYFDVYLLK